jgi:outer membrane immunogenic protein
LGQVTALGYSVWRGIAPMVVAGVVIVSSPAHAQSVLPYAAEPAPVAYNWAGGYFGLNIGQQLSRVTNLGARPTGLGGGGQAGYNWQSGRFVIGGEMDLQGSAASDTFAGWQFSNPWFGTTRGRAGFAMQNMLFYVTAGLAYGELEGQLARMSASNTRMGWTAGGGVEVGINRNWSARAEYLFIDFADRAYIMAAPGAGLETNLLRLGVNYRF